MPPPEALVIASTESAEEPERRVMPVAVQRAARRPLRSSLANDKDQHLETQLQLEKSTYALRPRRVERALDVLATTNVPRTSCFLYAACPSLPAHQVASASSVTAFWHGRPLPAYA